MIGHKRPPAIAFLLLIAVCVGGSTSFAEEKVRKAGGSLTFNRSALIPPHRWAHLSYSLMNPTNDEADIKLRLSPIGQRNVTVFEIGTAVAPGMRLRYHDLVTVGSVREHSVDLIVNGERVTKVGEREQTNQLSRFSDQFVIFLNDDSDVGRGQFNGIPKYGGLFVNSGSSAKYMSQHWAGYDSAHAVIVQRPDYDRLTSRQYRALLTYVGRGGTLIFADPHGTMRAWQTPLGKCMPAVPLRVRTVEHIPEFRELGGEPAEFQQPIEFLEMQPKLGISTVKHGEFPLIHWGRYGLGYVGICAIRPNDRELSRNNFFMIYRHLFRYGGRFPYITSTTNPQLSQAADKLSGVEIPPAGLVHCAIGGYVFLVILLIVVGATRKSLGKAWGIVAVTALFATIGVFAYAAYLRRNLPAKSASVLEFRNYGCAELCREQVASLMLKSESTIDLADSNPDLALRATPPPTDLEQVKLLLRRQIHHTKTAAPPPPKPSKKKKAGRNRKRGHAPPKPQPPPKKPNNKVRQFGKQQHGEKETFQDPLWVSVDNGISVLKHLTLRDSKPQFINTLAITRGRGYIKLPELSWADGRPEIAGWKVPGDIPCEQAVLLCAEGSFPIALANGALSCSAVSPPTDHDIDPGIRSLRRFFALSPVPSPAIALFANYRSGSDPNGFLPADFRINGRIVTFVPVIEEIAAGKIRIPEERIEVSGSPYNRRIMRAHGIWIGGGDKQESAPLLFTAKLPLGYERLEPDRISIRFDVENLGGNMDFRLSLYPLGNEQGAIPLKKNAEGRYEITGALLKKPIIHPADGAIVLGLEVKAKRRISDQVARARLNGWHIKDVRVSVSGTMPKQHHGRL